MTSALLNVAGVAVSPDHYIDGRRVPGAETFELARPIDQAVLGRVAEGGDADVEQAIVAAQRAFAAWSALSAAQPGHATTEVAAARPSATSALNSMRFIREPELIHAGPTSGQPSGVSLPNIG